MRSLFAKILLWFLVTVGVTVVGVMATTFFSTYTSENAQPPFSRLVRYQLREAVQAYESGGREGLSLFLERIPSVLEAEGCLVDREGRDLATGQDRSALLAKVRTPHFFPVSEGNRLVVSRSTHDGKYSFLLLIPERRMRFWFLRPQYIWIIGAVVLLCYGLALHLTSPLRALQKTVERFGQGDLSSRVRSYRRDELGELSRAFDRMADRMETLLAAEHRLLLDISHELRSPLARLGVAVELARSGEDRDAALDRIQKEADRLNGLVGELLQVTRAEGDASTLQWQPVSLNALLSELADDCSFEAQARGCRIDLKPSPEVTLKGVPELLRRALENVIRNAIRYSPEGKAVEISLAADGDSASVRVRDYGPGVPEDSLPRLFDPFYRVDGDRNRSSGGVGLGLSIARRAVDLHHGTIRARNVNPGLEVECVIPLFSPAKEEA